jgi:hypothetical protein
MKNQVQLITYADRLGGDLAALTGLLQGPLAGLFGGVHLLPFFTRLMAPMPASIPSTTRRSTRASAAGATYMRWPASSM